MPKKAPKNAFYYFMLDFKEEQQKKGITYENLGEVSKAADPEWRNASSGVRAKYDQIAKRKKQQDQYVPDEKYTSFGVPVSAVEQQQREKKEQIEAEEKDIRNMIKLKAFNNKVILDEYFYVMDVNYFCKTDVGYLIGESTVLRFNLNKGFIDYYHVNINPGRIPFGYASDVKLGCQEYGLDMPDESRPTTSYIQIMANIVDYLKQSEQGNVLPPLYTMPDKTSAVQNFIQQLCFETGEDETIFRIYRLDKMFFTLINSLKINKNEGFPYTSMALSQLTKDMFKYTPNLGCQHHEDIDKSVECTTSRTKRWAYTIMDSCCPIVGIPIEAGRHVPLDYNIEGIMAYKDKKKARAAPTVAGVVQPGTSSCNSFMNDSFLDTSGATQHNMSSDTPQKEKRTYAPMRMPQADYSKEIRPAPELTEDNFPTLSAGAGRGRGLTSSFKKLNIKK